MDHVIKVSTLTGSISNVVFVEMSHFKNQTIFLSRVIDIKCDGKICRNGSRCKRGNCICPKNCDDSIYEPVCGSDGHTVSTFTIIRKTIQIYT